MDEVDIQNSKFTPTLDTPAGKNLDLNVFETQAENSQPPPGNKRPLPNYMKPTPDTEIFKPDPYFSFEGQDSHQHYQHKKNFTSSRWF